MLESMLCVLVMQVSPGIAAVLPPTHWLYFKSSNYLKLILLLKSKATYWPLIRNGSVPVSLSWREKLV